MNDLPPKGTVISVVDGERHEPTRHVVGAVYWCAYWQQAYIVQAIVSLGYCTGVAVLWDDNDTGEHCTQLDYIRRDYRMEVAS